MTAISVVIPVGPHESNTRWLPECLQSVANQTFQATEVLLIDDSGVRNRPLAHLADRLTGPGLSVRVWRSPWNMGVAHAFNCGVGLATYESVFMLGSDDVLEPDCLGECLKTYERLRDEYGYYYVGVRYMDTGGVQDLACNAAMVTKTLWRHIGGFPIQAASGAPDAALISIMLAHGSKAGRMRPVADGRPLYNYRRHNESDTASKAAWQGIILATRDLVTREWRPGGLP